MSRSMPNNAQLPPTQRAHEMHGREAFPLADADLCVKCGLCLPHCPTYRLFQDESESPRGRIALMQGLATEQLEPSSRLAEHLDRCLGCRNCEPVCPANVPYGRLIDHGRRLLARDRPRPRSERLLGALFSRPGLLRFLTRIGRGMEALGLRHLARLTVLRLSPRLRRLDSLLPRLVPAARREVRSGSGDAVQLFLGCIAEAVDSATTDAVVQVLQAGGYAVHIPAAQGCCGAVSQHGGHLDGARSLSRNNVVAFSGQAPVLASASGCTATLMEYSEIEDDEAHRQFGRRVRDICDFLADSEAVGRIPWQSLDAKVLIHTPCSQRNVVGAGPRIPELLGQVPGIRLATLEDKGQCCGAAGAYLLSQPAVSEQLGNELAERACLHRPDFIVTSNIGCKLQLRSTLATRLPHCQVLHPAELLARLLPAQ